jgi:hypothetical protein
VLGLTQEVDRHDARFGAAVSHHHDLGGSGDRVDADRAQEQALGRGYIDVARPDDLVDLGYARGAKG